MNILIVEDAHLERKRLERIVNEINPKSVILSFEYPEDALETIKTESFSPDIAFLDIEMPGISGIELAEKLTALHPKTNIIFTTAYTNYMSEAFDLFASGYLLKPFSAADIEKQLQHLRFPIEEKELRFHAKTAGNFEFYCDGMPLTFNLSRAKELLAYLVDRSGASVTKKDMFFILFGESEYTANKQDYLKKIIRALKQSLANANGEDLLIHSHNSYAINTSLFTCDLYKAIEDGKEEEFFSRNPYMEQYSWAKSLRNL